MRPLLLELKDFRSFAGVHLLDLQDIQLGVIVGPNGAGKSSLIDAILFALYGKARKRPERLINDLAPSCHVKLTFRHNQSIYRVERYLERGKSQKLFLFEGDKPLTERKGLLTPNQLNLDKILNISYDLLVSSAIGQQEEINKLSTMTPGDREQIINEMLCNQHWEDKKTKAGSILNEYKEVSKTIKDKRNELDNIKANTSRIELEIIGLDQEIHNRLHNTELIQLSVDKLREDFKKYEQYKLLEGNLALKRANVKQLKKELDGLPKETRDSLNQVIYQLTKDIEKRQNLTTDIQKELTSVENKINLIRQEINEANNLYKSDQQTKILDEVPCIGLEIHNTCKLLFSAQQIKKETAEKLKLHGVVSIDELRQVKTEELAKLTESKKFLGESLTSLTAELYDARVKITEANLDWRQVEKATSITKQIDELQLEINTLEIKFQDIPKFNGDEYLRIQSELNEQQEALKEFEIYLAKKTAEKEFNIKRQGELEDELNKFIQIEMSLANYRILYDAYTNIPSHLFKQAIPTIELYANQILEKIFPAERISLRAFKETDNNTLQKTLDVVGSISTGLRDFEDLSGSEKFRQSIALRMALARYNSEEKNAQIDFFMVDEGFGSLDDDNVTAMKLMLQQMPKAYDLFLIITHLNDLKDTFKTQITVNPTGKGEKLVIHG